MMARGNNCGKPYRRVVSNMLLILRVIIPSLANRIGAEEVRMPQARFKVLHIMSFHSPWEWTDEQFRGFKDALTGVEIEYKVFQMDTKRNRSPEWKEKVARGATHLIKAWKPDLVYTNDDLAQELVVKNYVNSEIPFVFSGVNADPKIDGFVGSKNITGVLEQEHFIQSVQLLREIVPHISKVAVVLDKDLTWDGVVKRMQDQAKQLPGIEFVSWDVISTFDEYKQKVMGYQGKVDAIASLCIFTFKDANGKNVPYQTVLKWTAQNSAIPDFSFWESRIGPGTLCVVTVSGYEQGLAAGKIARGILVEARSPASFAMEPVVKGEPMISLARARRLGIPVKTSILLTARVADKFDWEGEELGGVP
jgi:ABC-type uncharacterized transport system substrate-binding protein